MVSVNEQQLLADCRRTHSAHAFALLAGSTCSAGSNLSVAAVPVSAQMPMASLHLTLHQLLKGVSLRAGSKAMVHRKMCCNDKGVA